MTSVIFNRIIEQFENEVCIDVHLLNHRVSIDQWMADRLYTMWCLLVVVAVIEKWMHDHLLSIAVMTLRDLYLSVGVVLASRVWVAVLLCL